MEVPAALREFAEAGISQTRETYEMLRKSAEEASNVLETSCASAGKGTVEYGSKLIEITNANTKAAFDFAAELMNVRSFSEMVELSANYTRQQLEALTDQTKELTALAQKIAAETSEPMKSGISKVFKQ